MSGFLRVRIVLLILFGMAAAPGLAADFAAGLNLGARGGPGLEIAGTTVGLVSRMPLEMRLGLGQHRSDAGDPYAARRIFINNNTNGTPEKSGRLRMVRMDFLVPAGHLGAAPLRLFGGPRYASYRANFNYVGGNENFDVTGGSWGWGLGLETGLPVSSVADLVLELGVDRFGESELTGHDTTYSPDGLDVNPREDYTFADADEAIGQPGTQVVALVGVRIGL